MYKQTPIQIWLDKDEKLSRKPVFTPTKYRSREGHKNELKSQCFENFLFSDEKYDLLDICKQCDASNMYEARKVHVSVFFLEVEKKL